MSYGTQTNDYAYLRQHDPAFWWANIQLGGRSLKAHLVWIIMIPLTGLVLYTAMISINLVASKVYGYNELSGVSPHAVIGCPGSKDVVTNDMEQAFDNPGALCPTGKYRMASFYYGHEKRNFDNFRDGFYPEGGVVTTANDGVLFWIPFTPFLVTWVFLGIAFMMHPQIWRIIKGTFSPKAPRY